MNISVLVLTYNEEDNLPHCLESLKWCDDIVILDSYSADHTINIAKTAGARVFQRKFDNYASQRNYGINQINYKHQWVLMIDADEQTSNELVEELKLKFSKKNEGVCLYRIRRKDFFSGRWIKRSSGYPTWFGRLIKVGYVRIERPINEEYNTDGETDFLTNHLIHYPFSKGLESWIEKQNRYSTMEANLIVKEGLKDVCLSDLFNRDPANRRRAIKAFIYRIPFRPVLIFIVLYIFRCGFIEGRPGLTFCLLRSFYEFLINCKVKEIQLHKKN